MFPGCKTKTTFEIMVWCFLSAASNPTAVVSGWSLLSKCWMSVKGVRIKYPALPALDLFPPSQPLLTIPSDWASEALRLVQDTKVQPLQSELQTLLMRRHRPRPLQERHRPRGSINAGLLLVWKGKWAEWELQWVQSVFRVLTRCRFRMLVNHLWAKFMFSVAVRGFKTTSCPSSPHLPNTQNKYSGRRVGVVSDSRDPGKVEKL